MASWSGEKFELKRAANKADRLRSRLARFQEAGQLANLVKMKELSPRQKYAIRLMSDFIAAYPMEYVANEVGVPLQKLNRWRNNLLFIRELDIAITKRKSIIRMEAFRQLFRKVKKGDVKCLQMYFKMSGDLKEQVEVTDKTPLEHLDETSLDFMIEKESRELGIEVE